MPAIDVSGLVDELRTRYVALVPPLGADGVFEVEHLEMVPWSELTLPYGIILCSDFAGTRRTLGGLAFLAPVELWYVQAISGPSSGLRTVLETVIDGFWPAPDLTKGQLRDVLAWGYGSELEPNRRFIANGETRRAGFVRLSVQVGRTRA